MKIKKPLLQRMSAQETPTAAAELVYDLPAGPQHRAEQETRSHHLLDRPPRPAGHALPFTETQTEHCIPPLQNTQPFLALQRSVDTGGYDEEAAQRETMPLSALESIRRKTTMLMLSASIALLFFSGLFLGVLAALIVVLADPLYKVEILIVFFVAFSYLASAQIGYIRRMRRPLSATQVLRAVSGRPAATRTRDPEHFALAKQDTTAYLRALTSKDLRRGPRL